jgi:protein-L-isoaspartate O-methyltransferase
LVLVEVLQTLQQVMEIQELTQVLHIMEGPSYPMEEVVVAKLCSLVYLVDLAVALVVTTTRQIELVVLQILIVIQLDKDILVQPSQLMIIVVRAAAVAVPAVLASILLHQLEVV